MTLSTLLVLSCATLALGQRPFFAGSRPIGYPEVTTTEGLGDRFGENNGTTQRLPVEANGDRDLVDRISKLPVDQQPFWFINWQALEANRQKPQTYPQKPNPFVDPNAGNTASKPSSSNFNTDRVPEPASSGSFVSSGSPSSGISSSTNVVSSGFLGDRFGSSVPSGNPVSSGSFGSSGSSGTPGSGANFGFFKPNRYSAEEHPNNDDKLHLVAGNVYNSSDKKNV